jgi:GT2 family glycosyltransferase
MSLRRTLQSLVRQSILPAQVIVIDGSFDSPGRSVCESGASSLGLNLYWCRALEKGAAAQRNQGVALATQPFVWFFDDDIIFESNCTERLWNAIASDRQLGGVNAMIANQRYQSPGFISRALFAFMHGCNEKSFAGRVIGPAINLLPEDREDLPEIVPVEWLNTTCTLYRREALPKPPFDATFEGYSLMEDLALSLNVTRRGWKLANVRTARIFHDSVANDDKPNAREMAEMELINRHYVMTRVLERKTSADYLRLFIWEVFQIVAFMFTRRRGHEIGAVIRGKWRAWRRLRRARTVGGETEGL